MSRELVPAAGDIVLAGGKRAKRPHLVIIVDTSDSMGEKGRLRAANEGLARLIAQQKAIQSSDATITIMMFNNGLWVVYEGLLSDVPPIRIRPNKMTAIRLSVVVALQSIFRRVATQLPGMEPDEVVIAFITDGEETLFDFKLGWDRVAAMVNYARTRLGWKFAYFTISKSAGEQATTKLGLEPGEVTVLAETEAGMKEAFEQASGTFTTSTTRL